MTELQKQALVDVTLASVKLTRLLSWMSPVFPIGGFAYSQGLERAVGDRLVKNSDTMFEWIATILTHGSQWNDAVLFCQSWRVAGNVDNIARLSQLAQAIAGSKERYNETMNQGAAFIDAASHWFSEDWKKMQSGLVLPVAVGMASGLCCIEMQTALNAYLHTYVSNQLQAAIRLAVFGQDGAASLLARLEATIANNSIRASSSSLDELGSIAFTAEISAMNHETQQPRLFLS
jgi:urease accessory protein